MNRSENISTIAAALAAAQGAMGRVVKGKANKHFMSSYADLAAVADACRGALSEQKIAVVGSCDEDCRNWETMLLHESGEWIMGTTPLILAKKDMQGLGSAVTYARRYGLLALCNLAPEDDDGNAAVEDAAANGLADAFDAGVLDSLPPNASGRDKAEAFSAAILKQMESMKTLRGLQGQWKKREAVIERIRKFSDVFSQFYDHYEHLEARFAEPDEEQEKTT